MPKTSSVTNEKTYDRAVDKVRDELAGSKSSQITLLGEGVTAMLRLHPEWDGNILEKGKTLKGALDEVRKHATGGCSDPIQTTASLCGYYGIDCKDPRALALEVSAALMGGTTQAPVTGQPAPTAPKPDPFDLDALLGVL